MTTVRERHLTVAIALSLLLAEATPAHAQSTPAEAARALFLANCATCHGETGDGKGVTKLEKPARSFKDGGFSYGNTPDALLRTITNGIPGTPMPSFASALQEPQRRELASYVLSLGPPIAKVSEADTILVVRDKPLFVRGKLAPIAEGTIERPRGLLVGTPDGFTFEYRVDDVRLLGVRQGAFVERMDWQGRGGDPLKPLGKLVYTFGDGNPGPSFALRDPENGGTNALTARLGATFVRDGRATIAYILLADAQPLRTRVAWVEESPAAYASPIGSGFARTISIESLANGGVFATRVSATKTGKSFGSSASWIARQRADGTVEIQFARGLAGGDALRALPDGAEVDTAVEGGRARAFDVVTVLAPAWSDELAALIEKEMAR
jgi:mono/diheme cytochrome c family protein